MTAPPPQLQQGAAQHGYLHQQQGAQHPPPWPQTAPAPGPPLAAAGQTCAQPYPYHQLFAGT